MSTSAGGAAGTEKVRLFLLDDHEIVRRGLARPLRGRGRSRGGRRCRLRRTRRHPDRPALRPDVAILDARLPDGSGIDVCRAIRSRTRRSGRSSSPPTTTTRRCSRRSWRARRDTCSSRSAAPTWSTPSARVAAGQSLLDPAVTARVLERLRARTGGGRAGGADRAGARDPGADRRGPDQPADRPAALPGREDGEELRLLAAGQAGPGAPHPGRRAGLEAPEMTCRELRHRTGRRPPLPGPWSRMFGAVTH